MRKTLFFTLTLLIFLICHSVPTGFAQSGDPDYTVRVIYFLPRGNTPQPNIDTNLDAILKDAKKFYADQMERHGFGRKTFKLETDKRGNAVVHHVNGRFNDAHYHDTTEGKIWEEIEDRFDRSHNIYFVAIDISIEGLNNGNSCGTGSDHGPGGQTTVPASGGCFNLFVIAHELGHAFGLEHDFHSDTYIMSFGWIVDKLSPCHAEWLNVHRYFNTPRTDFNQNTEIEMVPPAASPPHAVRLRFAVTDPDGLYQAQLLAPATDESEAPGNFRILDCKSLKGQNGTAEFVTTELTTEADNEVGLQVIDVDGNFMTRVFPIDVTGLLPRGKVVSIPDANLAAVVRKTLGLAPSARIRQLDMLKLTRLEAEKHQITDLTGLEHAKNLKFLNLGANQIRDLTPLEALTQLKNLWVWENQIRDITPLLGLPHLTELDLSRNLIDDITSLTGLTQLRKLSLGGNQISDISFLAEFTQLKNLWVWENQIRDITPLLGLPHLTELFLDSNQIHDITPLTGLRELEYLHLASNQISDIRPLSRLTKLRSLALAGNPILDTVPLQTLRQNNPDLELDIDIAQGPVVRKVPPPSPPAMYWIDAEQGRLYHATGANVEELMPSVRNATSLATDVAGGKLYWAEKTSERTGRIRSANLNGTPNIRLVKELTSVPLDIALDAVGGKIYLTSSWGKVQKLDVDGTNFKPNLITDLDSLTEIALDVGGSKIYWAEQSSRIRCANLDGSNVETLVTDSARLTGITVAGEKLYWTTQPNESAGKIQCANRNGSNIRDLATVPGSPEDLVVDTTGHQLYWTNALGGIQRADLEGKNVQNLVTGLGAPSHLALGNALVGTPEPIVTAMPKITGPWLWMIAPTKPGQGGARSTDVDSLAIASGGAVTEATVATRGAKAGAVVGDYAWTLGEIAEAGENNINDAINKNGLVGGQNPKNRWDDINIEDHSAYALITLQSAAARSGVTMRVGSDDSIKVWLNGTVVHKNRVDRAATDFQDRFTVRLKKGGNLLLVKVSESGGGWSMFVGIDADVKTKQPSADTAAAPVLSALDMGLSTETVLLANYPNPFNPETWIPYQLSKPADVTLTIYSVDGQIVRRLALGHQPAGMYQTRSRAAYWDGRNALGEPVASGVYFYTFTAGDFTATRKMLIQK